MEDGREGKKEGGREDERVWKTGGKERKREGGRIGGRKEGVGVVRPSGFRINLETYTYYKIIGDLLYISSEPDGAHEPPKAANEHVTPVPCKYKFDP